MNDGPRRNPSNFFNDGGSQRCFGRLLDVWQPTISKMLDRYREIRGYNRRTEQDRKRSSTTIDDRFLRRTALGVSYCTIRQFKNELLRGHVIRAMIRTKSSSLIREHRVHSLKFARDDRDWTNENWTNILFIDESSYWLHICIT